MTRRTTRNSRGRTQKRATRRTVRSRATPRRNLVTRFAQATGLIGKRRAGGFALMDPEHVAELGRIGGHTAQRSGRAHRLTRAERSRGGKVGGRR